MTHVLDNPAPMSFGSRSLGYLERFVTMTVVRIYRLLEFINLCLRHTAGQPWSQLPGSALFRTALQLLATRKMKGVRAEADLLVHTRPTAEVSLEPVDFTEGFAIPGTPEATTQSVRCIDSACSRSKSLGMSAVVDEPRACQ